MGRLYVTSYASNQDLGVKKRTLPREVTFGPKSLKFVAIVIFASLAMIYLSLSTRGANLSVEVQGLDGEQEELQQKIERLNTEAARLKALNNVYTESTNNTMVPTTKVNYLPKDQTVAKK